METNHSEIENKLVQQIESWKMEARQNFFDQEKNTKSSHQPVSVNSSAIESDSLESKAASATLTTAFVPEVSHFRPSLSGLSAANVTFTTAGLSSFEEEEEQLATIAVPGDECSILTEDEPFPCRPSQIFMPEVNSTARAELRAKLLEKLNSQQDFLELIDEKLDSHHSEAMGSQRRNHSEAMEGQRGIMERQSSNHSEVIQLLERGQTRAATDEQLQVLIQEMKALQEQIETLKEQNGQTNEDVLKKLETLDAQNDMWITVCNEERKERYNEWRKSNLEERLQDAIVTITELRQANKELEEKAQANREDAEVVARQSAASKATGGHTHKANKSVRFRDVSNTQPSKTQLPRPKNTTKGIAPDCLKRADAKKEGTLSRREEIERSKAKNSLPSMRF